MILESKLSNFFKWTLVSLVTLPVAPAILGFQLFLYLDKYKSDNAITNFLKSMESKNKDIKKIAENYSSIKEVSLEKLLTNEELAKEFDKFTDKNDSVIVLQMRDKKNQAIAYCIFNQTRNQEKIYISPKYPHSKEAMLYISAKFEIKAEIYGKGLEYVVKNSKRNIDERKLRNTMHGNHVFNKGNTEYIAKDEYNKLRSECEEMIKIIIDTFKSEAKSLAIGIEDTDLGTNYEDGKSEFYSGESVLIDEEVYFYLSDNKNNFLRNIDSIESESYKKLIDIFKEIINKKLGYSDNIEEVFIDHKYAINSKNHEKFEVMVDYSYSEYTLSFFIRSKKHYKYSKTSYNEAFSKIEFV